MARKKYKPPSFDGASNRHINVDCQLITSPVFKSCSNNARLLYMFMRAEQYSVNENRHPEKDNTKFIFTEEQYKNKYGFTTNASSFRKARDELIEKGFIDCVEDNSHRKEANVYQYSSRWKQYNPDNDIDKRCCTKSMRNKIK